MNRNRRDKMKANFQPRHMRAVRALTVAALKTLTLMVRRMAAGFREVGKALGLAQQRDHYALSSHYLAITPDPSTFARFDGKTLA